MNITKPTQIEHAQLLLKLKTLEMENRTLKRENANLKALMVDFKKWQKQRAIEAENERKTQELLKKWEKEEYERRKREKMAEEAAIKLQEQFNEERQLELENKEYGCEICLDSYKIEEMYTLDECSHRFCFDCLKGHTEAQINENNAKIRCPNIECEHFLSEAEVQHVAFEKLEDFRAIVLKHTLETMPDFRYCPRTDCGGAMIKGENTNKMVCPTCEFEFCFECNDPYHDNSTCEEYQQWKIDNEQGDARFTEWARENTKPCPKCRAQIQKNGGCNKMTCRKCKAKFCWLCTLDLTNTRDPYTHFRGEDNPCNLYGAS